MNTKTITGELWGVATFFWTQHFEPWFFLVYENVLGQLGAHKEYLLFSAGYGSSYLSTKQEKPVRQLAKWMRYRLKTNNHSSISITQDITH